MVPVHKRRIHAEKRKIMRNITKRFRKLAAVALAAVVAVMPLTACSSSSSSSSGASEESIKKAGVLKVGIKDSVVGFGYMNPSTNQYEGIEVDLAKKIADELGVKVEFTPVTPTTRGQLLDSGEIDMVAATFTITDERKLSYDFTDPYYVDAVSVLVKNSSGIKNLSDFEGKKIAVVQSSTTAKNIQAVTSANITFVEFSDFTDCKLALTSGTVDGFAVDVSILSYYADSDCSIISARFGAQNYGIATKKGSEFSSYVNKKVQEWNADGTMAQIIKDNGVEASYTGK